MSQETPLVTILMGSDSDLAVMQETVKILHRFQVPFEVQVSSAHRTPARTAEIARSARKRGVRAIIAGAGAAAHLAGILASETTLPVIAVPIDATSLGGLDALLASVQMPGGIPVATMAIGKAGAKNAGLFVVEMLSTTDERLARELEQYRADMRESVQQKSDAVSRKLPDLLHE